MGAENPLVQKSYVDRSVEEVREEARRSAVAVQSQLAEASKRLAYHIGGLEERASEGDQRLTAQVEEVVRSIDSLRDYTAAVGVRVEKAEDSVSIRKLLAELSERVDKVEERAKPIIETLGRMGAGGGFFSAKPGKDKVAVGDANGNWELVDKSTLGGGGGGAPTGAKYLVTEADATLTAEVVVGATPGGELGGTWDVPTVDATHSGSSHAAVQAAAEATAAAADAAHVAAADPHTGYQKESEKGAVGGYAALDGTGMVPDAQIPVAIARDSEVTAAVAAHADQGTDAHDADAISNVPAGSVAANTVQGAINELDTDKVPTTRTITAGAALTGGGTLAADRTLDVAVDDSTIEVSGDALQVKDVSRLTRRIAQTAHEFTVGSVVRYTGTAYAAALADTAANAEVVGIVSAVADANNFTLQYGGRVTGLSGLTAGTLYFLSAATAGLLTATEPTTVGQVSKPLLLTDSTTTGYFFNFRGVEVDSAASYIPKALVNARGDTIVATGQDTVARQPVGANDEVFTGASGQSTGVVWQKVSNAMVATNAAIAVSKLAAGTNKQALLTAAGVPSWALPPGHEYDYVEFTAAVTISATTEATANTVVTANPVTFNGSEIVVIEGFIPILTAPAHASGNFMIVQLYEDGASIGRLGDIGTAINAYIETPFFAVRRRTPVSGERTYSLRAWRTNANGTAHAGVGGSGNFMPGFIRIIKAAS